MGKGKRVRLPFFHPGRETHEMKDESRPGVEQHDALDKWRCPQLGGPVRFHYCRVMNGGLPCTQLQGCWETIFDVPAYLEEHFTAEERLQIQTSALSRLDTIFQVLSRLEREPQNKR